MKRDFLESVCNSFKSKKIVKKVFKKQVKDLVEENLNLIADECRFDVNSEFKIRLFFYLIDEILEVYEDLMWELVRNKDIDEVECTKLISGLYQIGDEVEKGIEEVCQE